jgi:Tol biopolymer transport system component
MSIARSGIPLLALLAALGCESPTALVPVEPGLHIDVEGTLLDTIGAPASRVRIWVADSSVTPIAGAVLTFSYPDELAYWEMPWTLSSDSVGLDGFNFTTNARGGLSFFVHRLNDARSAWLRVQTTAGGITWADSILITTLPGRPAKVAMPVDTGIYKGNSAAWRAQVTDREGNPRTEVATLEAGTSGIEVAGTTVTALADPSRQMVRAKLDGVPLDSTWLSIVPPGELVVVVDLHRHIHLAHPTRFARLALDGSVFEEILPNAAFVGWNTDLPAQWMPDGNSIVFRMGPHIARKTLGGGIDTVLLAPAGFGLHCPMPSSDGLRIFAHRISLATFAADAWAGTVATKGADGAVVGPPRSAFGYFDTCPSPSPDGQFIAVASDRNTTASVDGGRLHVLGLNGPVVQNLGRPSYPQARWSPDGNWIVSAGDGTLFAIRANGADYRVLGTGPIGSGYESWATWSPDSKWIAVERHGPVIEIINTETGLRLPLGFTGYLRMPSWRPTPAP